MQINENGLVSFMTEVPSFYNVEFPMDYPIIAPFYADIDLRKAGQVKKFTDYTDYSSALLISCIEKSDIAPA
jgi:hypothetical protein